MHGDIAIYGYPGRKSGMEVENLKNIYTNLLHSFTILMLHTTIREVGADKSIESIRKQKLPLANYYALGHIHKRFEDYQDNSRYVYPGPTFPNNFQELSDLKYGSFQMVEVEGIDIKTQNIEIPLKEVVTIELEVTNGLTATNEIISYIDKLALYDKIVLLKLKGNLAEGKTGDICFNEIENFMKKKEAYAFLRNISSIKPHELVRTTNPTDNIQEIEQKSSREVFGNNPHNFNKYHLELMTALSIEKHEDERTVIYEERLLSELKTILEITEIL